jgi:hypothetical protein
MAITQPKVIQSEQNSNLICNSSRYSHIPNIKSLYQRTSKKGQDNVKFLWYIDLIFGIWLYLDELQLKLEFRSGRMIFGWAMSLELVFCLNFKLSGLFLDVLWYIDLIFGTTYQISSQYIKGRQRKVRTT